MDEHSDNLIEIHDLKYSRGPRVIFEDMNLAIKRGEITALMGPSGTGKTTLLRLITRQLIPQHGTILIDGVDISTLSIAELYQLPLDDAGRPVEGFSPRGGDVDRIRVVGHLLGRPDTDLANFDEAAARPQRGQALRNVVPRQGV